MDHTPDAYGDPQSIPPGILSHLRRTRPWVLFLSILGFISSALMVVFGLIGGAFGAMSGEPGMAILIVIYPLMGVLYLFPSYFLFSYAARIRDLIADPQLNALEQAMDAQRSFWKFIGIMMIVSLALGIIMAIFVAILAAGSMDALRTL